MPGELFRPHLTWWPFWKMAAKFSCPTILSEQIDGFVFGVSQKTGSIQNKPISFTVEIEAGGLDD